MLRTQTETPGWDEWNVRFLPECRFVVMENGEVAGWIAITRCSHREVYSGVVVDTLYVAAKHQGKGIGFSLLNHMLSASEQSGYWTVQARIFAKILPASGCTKGQAFAFPA